MNMKALTSPPITEAVTELKGVAVSLFAQLANGRLPGAGITRDTYGAGETRGHDVVVNYARQLGLEIAKDAAANTYMTLPGRNRDAPKIIVGSHLDSVPNGGNYDGAAGVVAGLLAVSVFKKLGIRPACDITVMAIRAEESIWFQVSYIGSRAALGMLPIGALDAKRFDTGRPLSAYVAECGGDPRAIEKGIAALDPKKIRSFIELHIEQAPTLVEAGQPIAVGTCIPGNFRYPHIRIHGRHDHVGMPRRFRHDAVAAGSELISAMDRLWAERDARGISMAITVGRCMTDPTAQGLTIVPGKLELSLDVRAYDPLELASLEADIVEVAKQVEERYRVRIEFGTRAEAPIGPCSPKICDGLADAAAKLGIAFDRIVSPASHDAAAFAQAGVPIGMIFVRNENGSHNPQEHMEITDLLDGTAVMAEWLRKELS
ncbi:MAG: Zn-dependent hydrolase [Pseudorhodoplanes sp.]